MKKYIKYLLLTVLMFNVTACDLSFVSSLFDSSSVLEVSSSESILNNSSTSSLSEEIDILEAVNKLQFNDKTFKYDGEHHVIVFEVCLPEYIEVTYENNEQCEIGEYEVKAILTDTTGKYQTLPIFEATLTIAEPIISGDFEYALNKNKEATITGYLGHSSGLIMPSYIDGYIVRNIGEDAFAYCSSITSIEIPESVTSVGMYAFRGCRSLINIKLPETLTSIGWCAFAYCSSLTSIEIPESVTSIGSYAFDICSSLTSIEIPMSVTCIGYSAFRGCSSLTRIGVNENNRYYKSIDGDLYNKNGTELIHYAIGKDNEKFIILDCVVSIALGAFQGCSSLASIVIPDSVTSIGGYTFQNCRNLKIYSEFDAPQDGWHRYWNYDNRPVYYSGEWEYVDGIPTPII